ncbi:MAG: 5-histidylcysteine sulfoxide synthase/putative 4-mercaptohistidine N1-methyltransferase [Paraglaciecola sp.]|jgi:5-histidylcysteine sulfoxide synthase/putative 4-mercaptohistidine N1-methyltranferase
MNMQLPKLNKPLSLNSGSAEQKRGEIKAYFEQSWALYESLFGLINDDEAFYLRPEPLRHPLIFYYGHTAVFYVNKLLLGKFIQQRLNHNIESVCAVGVDEMSWDDLSPGNYQWPDVDAVREYRKQVKAMVLTLIDNMPLSLPINQDSLAWVILMGCEHERIHIETSSVIMRMLDLKYLSPTLAWQSCQTKANAPANELLAVQGKSVLLGKTTDSDTYGWDNEYGAQGVAVEDFSATKYLVSNQEFLDFITAGGYHNPAYWTDEGQRWLAFSKAQMPRFWSHKDGSEHQYWQRNLLEDVPLPLNWPVEVNYLEAKAFCNWKDTQTDGFVRLPTEAEWQVMRDELATDLPDWEVAPGNINLEHFASSCPVDSFAQGAFYDVIGNVWQWTESPIDGYPGFKVHPLYDDFSTPTFDGQHNLIKGGSWISTGNEACRDSRYAFRRHFTQHAGFRYIHSKQQTLPITPANPYEMQPDISRMLHHHFGLQSHHQEHDLQKLLVLCQRFAGQSTKVLDLGCGVGRLGFELSKVFDQVDAIDFTARHIQHCLQLKEQGQLRYAMPSEGELHHFYDVRLHDLGFDTMPGNLNFSQGDGHNLKAQFSAYDLIVCHRVLDQVYDPLDFIHKIAARLNRGGVLILGSSYAWDTKKTVQAKWLGGYKQNGENLSSEDHLKQLLHQDFNLLDESNVAREYQLDDRNSQFSKNHITVWQKHR